MRPTSLFFGMCKQVVNKIDWVIYTFIAKGLRKIAEPKLDGGEK